VIARGHNRERRSTYRSAEEAHLGFARALAVTPRTASRFLVDPDRDGRAGGPRHPRGAYAAHPTTVSARRPASAHPDWPALFERAPRSATAAPPSTR
jgi:hypothetical protein